MESPAGQLALGCLDVLTQLDVAEGETPAPASHLLDRGRVELLGLPSLVGGAQGLRQPHDLAPVKRRQLAADSEHAVGTGLGQVELTAPGQGPHERGMAPPSRSEAKGLGGLCQWQVIAGRCLLEASRQPPQEPRGGGPENSEPELLDVLRPGIVAEGINDAVGPGADSERRREGRFGVRQGSRAHWTSGK
jgi:hypothetical protein